MVMSMLIDQDFGCQGKPFTLFCRTSEMLPSLYVNGNGSFFSGSTTMVISRDQIFSVFLNKLTDAYLSITIINLTDTSVQLACGGRDITQAAQYTVRPAGIIPQMKMKRK